MTTLSRADLLAAVAKLCETYPDRRLGQLIANVAGWADQEIWDVEDEQLLEAARLHLHLQQRQPETLPSAQANHSA